MLLFERSQIVNEPQKFFAWYPVPIRTLEFHREYGVKVCKTQWVIFKTVHRTIKIRSGIYYGSEYSYMRSSGTRSGETRSENERQERDKVES
jgi:hypothetical protein